MLIVAWINDAAVVQKGQSRNDMILARRQRRRRQLCDIILVVIRIFLNTRPSVVTVPQMVERQNLKYSLHTEQLLHMFHLFAYWNLRQISSWMIVECISKMIGNRYQCAQFYSSTSIKLVTFVTLLLLQTEESSESPQLFRDGVSVRTSKYQHQNRLRTTFRAFKHANFKIWILKDLFRFQPFSSHIVVLCTIHWISRWQWWRTARIQDMLCLN